MYLLFAQIHHKQLVIVYVKLRFNTIKMAFILIIITVNIAVILC